LGRRFAIQRQALLEGCGPVFREMMREMDMMPEGG
jgi:hypothetical protein